MAKPVKTNSAGTLMATSNNEGVSVWKVSIGKALELVLTLSIDNCLDYLLSPRGNYLATFEKLATGKLPTSEEGNGCGEQDVETSEDSQRQSKSFQHFNYKIWRLNFKEGKAQECSSFSHKNIATWIPQWSNDDRLMSRMVTEQVQFFDLSIENPTSFGRIFVDSLTGFSLNASGTHCAVFCRESAGKPGSVKIFPVPERSSETATDAAAPVPTCQKSFFKADRCRMSWCKRGRNLLAMVSSDIDKTGKSYYGETSLYFLTADGSFDTRVDLPSCDSKPAVRSIASSGASGPGPVHDFTWSPLGQEFIVLYGFMPATRTTLFDVKCKPIYTFDCGSKNSVKYSDLGDVLCFGGFGNLPGTIEIWRRVGGVARIGAMQATGTTISEWSSTSDVLLTAILTPRLRVDNGFKLWSPAGQLLFSQPISELYQATFLPHCDDATATKACSSAAAIISPLLNVSKLRNFSQVEVKKEAYVPPALRSKTPTSASVSSSSQKPKQPQPPSSLPPLISKETRAVMRVQEKLASIAAIKAKHAAGERLEPEQIEKMARENDLQKELDAALKDLDLAK